MIIKLPHSKTICFFQKKLHFEHYYKKKNAKKAKRSRKGRERNFFRERAPDPLPPGACFGSGFEGGGRSPASLVGDNKKSWDNKIKYALWADKITKKKSTCKSPFELVYGLDVTLPVHLKLPAYQRLQNFSTNKNVVQNRIDQIVELDEARRTAFEAICKNQSNIKKSFDKCSRSRSLQVGYTVLLWDRRNEKPGKHKKFDSLWLGPYVIRDIAGPNSFYLSRLDGEPLDLPVNGQMLKLFLRDDI